MRIRPFTVLFIVAAVAGLFFNAWATYDFVQHLDRQVHGIHCSFVPGLEAADVSGESGCATTLMSPYSSVFRTQVWGGLPMSLMGVSVFAYLLFRGLDLMVNRRQLERGTTLWLVLSSLLPVLTSMVMGYLSLVTLDAACKLCIGVYVSSFFVLFGAIGVWRTAVKAENEPAEEGGEEAGEGQEILGHGLSFLQGVAFVAVPLGVYVGLMPDYEKYVGACGELAEAPDANARFVIPLDPQPGGIPSIELLDPLCPTCRAFEERLDAAGLDRRLDRQAVLFPLDTCNWNVGNALHPGACTVSYAVLCAGDAPGPVIQWAFENQEQIRTAAKDDPAAAERMVGAAFPELKECVASPKTRQLLNKGMHWAAKNQLPVMTPQLFVDGKKLCDEDIDLGMDFALSRMVEGGAR